MSASYINCNGQAENSSGVHENIQIELFKYPDQSELL